jgi:hypothetical protein
MRTNLQRQLVWQSLRCQKDPLQFIPPKFSVIVELSGSHKDSGGTFRCLQQRKRFPEIIGVSVVECNNNSPAAKWA